MILLAECGMDNMTFQLWGVKSQFCWNWCQVKGWAHPLSSALSLLPTVWLSYRLYFHYFILNTNLSTFIKKGGAFQGMENWIFPPYSNETLTLICLVLCGHVKFTYNIPKCYILYMGSIIFQLSYFSQSLRKSNMGDFSRSGWKGQKMRKRVSQSESVSK